MTTTIAALAAEAAETYGAAPAVRAQRDGSWQDVSYTDLGRIVREIGVGLMGLIEPGDRVCLLANTRPEWTYVDLAIAAAGGIVVPIYPTNSAEECEWVASDSGAKLVVCEDADQAAKIAKVRDRLPDLATVITIEGAVAGAIPLDELRSSGASNDHTDLDRRTAAVRPEDPYTFVYTSGTTGPPKGCVLTHANLAFVCELSEEITVIRPGDGVYLYLPLAHVFARVVQTAAVRLGATIAYFGGDTRQLVAELGAVQPTYLPSVPRIFEKIYAMAVAMAATPEQEAQLEQAVKVGLEVRNLEAKRAPVPADLREAFEAADALAFTPVRQLFGGQLREATTGAAPIAPEILEFFYAAGVPVMEGYGMTETTAIATVSTPTDHRFGTVGRAAPGVDLRLADDGELLIRGENIFAGYNRNEAATAEVLVDDWLRTGDLAEIDDDGFVKITGRKKELIITAGGKNLSPANIENDLKQSRWISQAVMHGDRRPYPVALITLDAEEIQAFAKEHDLPTDVAALSTEPAVRELVQGLLDEVNSRYASVEQIKRFHILDHDLSQEDGELTPTLKLKRNVVNERYAAIFDALYL